MKTRLVKASEIREFSQACRDLYQNAIPITMERAVSQAANPSAKPDDVLLIVAEEPGFLAGFMGILPLPARDTEKRVFWNTGWWTEKGVGASVSLGLFRKFLEITVHRNAYSDLAPTTAMILEKLGYRINKRKGIRVRLRSGLHKRARSSARRDARLIANTGVFMLFDSLLNAMGYYQHSYQAVGVARETGFQRQSDESYPEFIDRHAGNQLCTINRNGIRWWEGSSWLSPEKTAGPPYPFSHFADSFHYEWFEMKQKGELSGLALLSVRDGVMKTQYFWVPEEESGVFYRVLWSKLLRRKDIHSLISFDPGFTGWLFHQKLKIRGTDTLERSTAVSEVLLEELDFEPGLKDGDGDYLFT